MVKKNDGPNNKGGSSKYFRRRAESLLIICVREFPALLTRTDVYGALGKLLADSALTGSTPERSPP